MFETSLRQINFRFAFCALGLKLTCFNNSRGFLMNESVIKKTEQRINIEEYNNRYPNHSILVSIT